ncbi:hypothetical protein IFR05_002999 [Cadophora sp. M221]|nr:hypothetical protein IFR05_002999 [Cadophora sp. M221]
MASPPIFPLEVLIRGLMSTNDQGSSIPEVSSDPVDAPASEFTHSPPESTLLPESSKSPELSLNNPTADFTTSPPRISNLHNDPGQSSSIPNGNEPLNMAEVLANLPESQWEKAATQISGHDSMVSLPQPTHPETTLPTTSKSRDAPINHKPKSTFPLSQHHNKYSETFCPQSRYSVGSNQLISTEDDDITIRGGAGTVKDLGADYFKDLLEDLNRSDPEYTHIHNLKRSNSRSDPAPTTGTLVQASAKVIIENAAFITRLTEKIAALEDLNRETNEELARALRTVGQLSGELVGLERTIRWNGMKREHDLELEEMGLSEKKSEELKSMCGQWEVPVPKESGKEKGKVVGQEVSNEGGNDGEDKIDILLSKWKEE